MCYVWQRCVTVQPSHFPHPARQAHTAAAAFRGGGLPVPRMRAAHVYYYCCCCPPPPPGKRARARAGPPPPGSSWYAHKAGNVISTCCCCCRRRRIAAKGGGCPGGLQLVRTPLSSTCAAASVQLKGGTTRAASFVIINKAGAGRGRSLGAGEQEQRGTQSAAATSSYCCRLHIANQWGGGGAASLSRDGGERDPLEEATLHGLKGPSGWAIFTRATTEASGLSPARQD